MNQLTQKLNTVPMKLEQELLLEHGEAVAVSVLQDVELFHQIHAHLNCVPRVLEEPAHSNML